MLGVVGVGARDRMVRVLSLVIGVTGVAFLLTANPSVGRQLPLGAGWWNALALLMIALPPLVLAVGSFTLPVRWLRGAAGIFVAGHLLVYALVPWGFARSGLVGEAQWPWAASVPAAAGCALPLVAPAKALGPYLVALVAMYGLAVGWAAEVSSTAWLVRHAVACASLGLVFGLVTAMALRGGAILDADTERLKATAVARSRAAAADGERARVDALVHDTVLSALLAGGRGADMGTGRAAARLALAALDELARPPDPRRVVPYAELVARLRQVCGDVDTSVALRAAPATVQATAEVARMLQEVVGEVVCNSVCHAGVPGRVVARGVEVSAAGGVLTVRVVDDGAGFDPGRVDQRRLGLAVGVRGRVARFPGAVVEVSSQPGLGTAVTVTVSADAREDPAPAAGPTHPAGGDRVTAPGLIGLHSAGAAVVAVFFVVAEAMVPLTHAPAGLSVAAVIVPALLLLVGAALLLAPGGDPMPTERCLLTVGSLWLAGATSLVAVGASGGYIASALWPAVPATVILAFCAVRGRILLAWCGQAGMFAVTAWWMFLPGADRTGLGTILHPSYQGLILAGALAGAAGALREEVARAVCAQLGRAAAGRLTARVLPPGRGCVCTVVREDGDSYDVVEVRGGGAPGPALAAVTG